MEQVKVEAAIGQNEEEFKEINETVQQTSDAAPNQSFRDIPVHIPLLELPEGQSHSARWNYTTTMGFLHEVVNVLFNLKVV